MSTEEMVRKFLEEHFGLQVEKIPECEQKTPDFFVHNGEEKYLIEVKEKESNPEISQGREKALSNGELYEIAQSIEPKTTLANIVRSGKRQIDSFVEDENTFRIIWVHCSGLAYSATKDQILSGIYGSETVVDWGNEGAFSGTCYYFNESQFFRYRDDIDAVIVSCRNSEVQMCLNNHSPRYQALKSSSLSVNFKQGLCDPLAQEEYGLAFIVDAPIDRSDTNAVLSFLKEKYNTEKLMVMPMNHFEAHVAVPHDEM